ncbi:molecular chaperone SurA [Mitsuaria sp. TWR114]|uniref:peptidylprolyl isomerase n=1 Tax=unclassified Roseateles TaxID=2626991 RepID=UPI0011BFD81A|nr:MULTISPECIES: peptidylprolyl isomerase [unclassified Roseateles]MBB3296154.1 peptidyl-prolyl cis-trans isomerase SurA [Mitsuaria sp. BK041]MBB3365369.1 peptidyl-prolyl cis-trans isomerase SurA [Mitsuaria sp. BK045]TXD95934.1 molecular chaperone SurA [Mitsuaria sp. TWR114]
MRHLKPVAATLLSLTAALAGSASSAQTRPAAPAPAASAASAAAATPNRPVVEQRQLKPGDYIAAIVNTDIVAASEVIQRTERMREEARQRGQNVTNELLHKQALDSLIDERVVVTYARENGPRVDEPELDRVVANVATQNKLTMPELRQRLAAEGIDFKRFRENLRDQMLSERVREREVQGRIRVTDGDIDKYLDERQAALQGRAQLNVAQILVPVPEGAGPVVLAERKARAESALARVKAGEDFAKVARELSEDANKNRGGEIGLRAADKLPDVFVDAVKDLQPGEVRPELLRSEAGFHVMKLIERQTGKASINVVVQTRARHILLRPSEQLTPEQATRRLVEFKRAIESGRATFEQLARANSEDGSAQEGGDLGWVSPGGFVPEFEQAMDALPLKGISDPVPSRFGIHLIQVMERRDVVLDNKQLREQARNALRERKYDDAYNDWMKEMRARAFIETREWLD